MQPTTFLKPLFLIALVGLLSPVSAFADEVHLLCTGSVRVVVGQSTNAYTGLPDDIYGSKVVVRQIRFDEAMGELWYLGADGLSKKGAVDKWIPAADVVFEGDKIKATFKRSTYASIASFSGKSKFELDRLTGVWSNKNTSLQCALYDATKRKF